MMLLASLPNDLGKPIGVQEGSWTRPAVGGL